LKVTKYREIVDCLARYATPREKATGPKAAIGVQSDGTTLKLISGTETAGMITVVPDAQVDGVFVYAISARPLLESAKVLPTKDTVTISATKDALVVTASGGGSLVLRAEGAIKDVGFPAKPKGEPKATGRIDAIRWGQLSRIIPEIADKIERPSIHTGLGELHISIASPGNRPRYASIGLPSGSNADDSVVTELDFWLGLRALQSDNGVLAVHEHGVIAKAGGNEVYSTILQREFQWPLLSPVVGRVSFDMERGQLSTAIKAQASGDEFNRVTVNVSKGMVKFSPFNKEGGLSIPAKTTGEGTKSFNADYMKSLLSAMTDTKHVTLSWGDDPKIQVSAKEYDGWLMLIAPVALG
jgi:hypothetical protein